MRKVNFIQDEATPHNNILIKSLVDELGDDFVNIYYAIKESKQYKWDRDITNEIKEAKIYGTSINWNLIKYYLKNHRKENFFMVGWGNATTRLIFLISCIFRTNLNMWFDLPNDSKSRTRVNKIIRDIFYKALKLSRIKIYCVGKITVKHFLSKGFENSRLENLPIQVEVSDKPKEKTSDVLTIFTGSRLTKDKGYDVLITALSKIKDNCEFSAKIAGTGPELDSLKEQVRKSGLEEKVEFIGWLSPEEFSLNITQADIFIHPARVDAYGGSALALAKGIPVIGSNTAGAVIECLVDGENGFSYDAENYEELSRLILKFAKERSLILAMSERALIRAKKYDVNYWTNNLIREML